MPTLILTKAPDGSAIGDKHSLGNEPILIGRSPERCAVVLAANAVSREHARIIADNGKYFLEDLRSRNKTFLNNKPVEGRWPNPLRNGDRIKICDFLLAYEDESQGFFRPRIEEPEEEEESTTNTTVEASIQRLPNAQLLDTQPTEKLRAILDISTALSKTLDVESLFPQIADELFKVFKQADRCFVIELHDNKLIPIVQKSRRPGADEERFSRTIVRRCLESQEAFLSHDAANEMRGISESVADVRIRSVMCAPLVTPEGQSLAVIQLDSQSHLKRFSQDDLKLLMSVAAQAAIAIENARLHTTLLAKEKIEEENRSASKVQLGFLPQSLPLLPGYDFFAHYMAARTVGGDYYDFIPLEDGRLAILLGDVSGKGVPAALLMARLSGDARVSILTRPDLASAITYLNDLLMQADLQDRYVTLSATIIDPKNNQLEIVNAGHLSPWLYRHETGEFIKLFDKGWGDFPLGWVPGHKYCSRTMEILPGDSLIIYTDGIEDAQAGNGNRFTTTGVEAAIAEAKRVGKSLTARELGDYIVQAVQTHVGTNPQFDDIAIISYGRTGAVDPNTPTATGERPTIA